VPNPTNPQSLNRYSYTRNSPLNLIDPTGHRECDGSNDCSDPFHEAPPSPPSISEQVAQGSNIYGIIFKADKGQIWTNEKMEAVLNAARDIENRSRLEGSFPGYAPGQVWKETHGIVTMLASSKTHYTDSDGLQHEITYGAETFGSTIEVYGSASDDPFNFKLNMVHEFAHVFNGRTVNTTDMDPYNELGVAINEKVLPPRSLVRAGMSPYPYQQSSMDNTTNNELFADMYVNWTYQSFTGMRQQNWMNSQMPIWLGR